MRPLTRQSRHPVMIAQMLGVAIIAAWQILSGPERHVTLWHVPIGSYLPLALVALVGCLANLTAAMMSDSWTAGAFEIFGSVLVASVLGVDLWSVLTTTLYPDTDIVAGLLAGLLAGLVIRILSVSKDVILVVKDQRAPPIGDLDLMAADRVDSATALVLGSTAMGSHAAGLRAAEAKELE